MSDDVCQRWRAHRSTYRPAGEPIDPRRYGVEVVSEALARAFVEGHHYSRTFPAARLSAGLFRAGVGLVGVCVFAVPMQPKSITRHAGRPAEEGVELARFVLLDEEPANAETWFLRRAFAALRREKPSVRAVVSYSDPVARALEDGTLLKPGHIGTIYRAHNGRYVGRSSRRVLHMAADGRVLSGRTLSKLRTGDRGAAGAYQTLLDLGAPRRLPGEGDEAYVARALREGPFRRLPHPGNLAYVWALDRQAEQALPPPAVWPGRSALVG